MIATYGRIANRLDAGDLATLLIGASAWFAVTPLPDDEYRIEVKADCKRLIEKWGRGCDDNSR